LLAALDMRNGVSRRHHSNTIYPHIMPERDIFETSDILKPQSWDFKRFG
jgi:hypothetical protein